MTKEEALKLCDYLECNDASMEAQCKAAAFIRKALAQPEQTEVQRLIALVRAQQITIDKLEAALAQPEQEPVACKHEWFRTGAMQSWEY